ncbi:MAG: DNA topoisomerase VI subunit B [Candidatus Woesearchaeota archaeon]
MAQTAEQMAKGQRDISIAEFFEKNRHLLGFDNKRKALLTTIKEAVDNSLDACEEAGILPEILIEIVDMGDERYRVIVEDNGPGIVRSQIPKIFAKLLYGSKFHRLKQSRGQQGIGISASVMYGQLTTGRPAKITSKIASSDVAHYFELRINTQKNKPEILRDDEKEWNKTHGTRIELDLTASYLKGNQSVDEYIRETAIVNPHVTIIYTTPKAEQIIFQRATEKLPLEPKEIMPHPYGVELGTLIKMLNTTPSKSVQGFLTTEFSRVSLALAKKICENARLPPNTKPAKLSRQQAEDLYKGINETKIMSPPTDCIAPIGSELIEKGIKKEINAEFYCSVTRPPSVYRGNPFVIEAAIAYGGDIPSDRPVEILRFANRVPLLYQQGACACTKSMIDTNWRPYGMSQSQRSLPIGPAIVIIHLASVWAPFTSEAKEAIAHYPEIIKEMKLALRECGRKLGVYVSRKKKVGEEMKKRSYIEKYMRYIGEALNSILGDQVDKDNVNDILKDLLERRSMPKLKHRDVADADLPAGAKKNVPESRDDETDEDIPDESVDMDDSEKSETKAEEAEEDYDEEIDGQQSLDRY